MENRGKATAGESDLALLESVVLAHPAVGDCAAVRRGTESGAQRIVVYFVPSGPVDISELRCHVESSAAAPTPVVFVPITSMPVTEAGTTDHEALGRLAVFEPELTASWQKTLEGLCPGPVAVLVDDDRRSRLPLHVADLMSRPMAELSRREPPSAQGRAKDHSLAKDNDVRPPAVADGGELSVPPDAAVELVDILRRAANEASAGIHYGAAGRGDGFQSYADLARAAKRISAGLRAAGLKPGERVLLQLARPRDFLEGFWATIVGGFVPVPLAVPTSFRQPAAIRSLESAVRLLGEPPVLTTGDVIGDVEQVLCRISPGSTRAFASEDLMRRPDAGFQWHSPQPEDVALLMLTSGSTGIPKAVELTHRNLTRRTLGSIQRNGFDADDVSLNWMPLDHVAGLIYFHLRDTQLGCRQIQLETQIVVQNPLAWLDAMDEFRVTVTFAPNFAYGLVNDRELELAARHWDLSSVRLVLNGAEAVVARTARRFLRLLAPHGLSPNAMHPAWGMSETSSGVTYSDRFSLATTTDDDTFVEVGRPIPGVKMRIIDGSGRVVGEGTVGGLQVQGEVVTRGYFRNDTATREAFTGDAWFKTGDLGFIRDGRLTVTGREKDVVIINGVNYYSHAIESAVEEIEGVVTSYTAACAVRDETRDTDRLAIFFHPSSFESEWLRPLLGRIRTVVQEAIGIGVEYLVPVPMEAIPKTSLGKIQRSLLSEGLTRGGFDEELKTVDRLTAASNTIPDWYFRKTWVRREGRLGPHREAQQGLVLLDEGGVGLRLVEAARAWSRRVASVAIGTCFERRSATEYRFDPARADDYQRLMTSLRGDGIDPDWIVHLWTHRPGDFETPDADSLSAAQIRGSASLLRLAQAIARTGGSGKSRTLAVVGAHVARVVPGELLAVAHSPILGFVKSIPQEMPNLQCLHVDLVEPDAARAAQAILDELRMVPREREVGYRGGERFVARLTRVQFEASERSREIPLEEGGFYLVSGGLGGIGGEITKFLVEEIGACLLLIGRTEIPLAGERQNRLQSLGGLSKNVAYERCDVTDRVALEATVQKYESRFGRKLGGAIHLAGDYAARLIVEESSEGFEKLLAPRALGGLNLAELLDARGGGVLVISSSLAGFFGGASIASYSAASAFLDCLHEHLEARGSIQSYCFQWSNWDGIGQARQVRAKDLPRSLGYLPVSSERAILSLRIGLTHRQGAMLVGLDADNRHVRRFLRAGPENLSKAYVYVGKADAAALRARRLDLRDRFGTPVPFEIVSIEELPLDEDGKLDVERLLDTSRHHPRGGTGGAKPGTEVERELAELFRETLGASDVGLDDSFFELGGDSLLAARVLSRIRDRFDVELSLRTIFENPRLGELARAVDAERKPSPSPSSAGDRDRGPIKDPESLLERVDELGDEEVAALLARMAEDDEATA